MTSPKYIDCSTRVVFRRSKRSRRKAKMVARVDTGASLTAIPHSLMKKLELKPTRQVRIRVGNDQTEHRNVVLVNVGWKGRHYEVEATVRKGKKLGKIPILGRNFLRLDKFFVRVPESCTSSEDTTTSTGSSTTTGQRSSSSGSSSASTADDSSSSESTSSDPSDGIILDGKAKLVFRKRATSSRKETMMVRVDTGASMTAIPRTLKDQLGLPVVDHVRIRLGTDAVDRRQVRCLHVQLHVRFTCASRLLW